MKKINLVLQSDQFTSFTSYYLEEYWRRYFDISIYDETKTYDRGGTVFVFWWTNAVDDLPKRLKEAGHHVAIDRLWEYPEQRQDFYWIQHHDWFRLNESLWWRALGYHEYLPTRNHSHLALLPMNSARPNRDIFFDVIKSLLDRMIWSYRGKFLPDDVDHNQADWQRYINPKWYDDTFCSIVVETNIDNVWTTEKSFRPMAFYHPGIFLSAPGHLSKMKSLGFATFDNIFDENYDTIENYLERCEAIFAVLNDYMMTEYDDETQKRLKHNHDHFFDKTLVETVIYREIVIPLQQYAET